MTLFSLLFLASWLLFSAFVGLRSLDCCVNFQFPAIKYVVRSGIGCALEQNLVPLATFLSRSHGSVIPGFVHRNWLPGGSLQTRKAQALLMVNDRL